MDDGINVAIKSWKMQTKMCPTCVQLRGDKYCRDNDNKRNFNNYLSCSLALINKFCLSQLKELPLSPLKARAIIKI